MGSKRHPAVSERVGAAVAGHSQAILAQLPTAAGECDQTRVHETRVAVRKLRAVLRDLPDAIAEPSGEVHRIETDLRWMALVLSPIRDVDVLRPLLRAQIERLDGVDRAIMIDQLEVALDEDRVEAVRRLVAEQRTARWRRLRHTLEVWAMTPPIAGGVELDAEAALAKARRRVRRRLRGAEDDEGRHQARKAAKRLRYLAETLDGSVKGAKKAAKRAKKQQTKLGSQQDLAVATAWVREQVALHPESQWSLLLDELLQK